MTTISTSGSTTDASDCTACSEGSRFLAMSRRGFLTLAGAVGIVTASTVGGARVGLDPLARAVTGTAVDADCLVVVSLRGGADGLSMVVPRDPLYRDIRPNIAIPESVLKDAGGGHGLPPALEPLFARWDAGQFAAVHAVGMGEPNKSHFDAMEKMEQASPESSEYTGWLDRCLGVSDGTDSPFTATAMGTDTIPTLFSGPNSEFAMRNINGVTLAIGDDLAPLQAVRDAVASLHDGETDALADPTLRGLDAVAQAQSIPEGTDGYPDGGLANAFRDVARLIKDPSSGIRFATVDFGGWDHHEGQGNATEGRMFSKLNELAQCMAAFADDLGDALDRTTVVTLSEFGRPLRENGNGGTDHGYGNCVLLLGGGVNGGQVHGQWPGLSEDALVRGDLAVTTDYRTIIAEILTDRCGIGDVSGVFPGLPAERLDVTSPR